MLNEIKSRVMSMIEEGKDLEEILSSDVTDDYDPQWDSGRRIGGPSGMLTAAYNELVKQ